MRRFRRLALAAGAAATLALPGGAAEPAASLRATASLGFDSNARRVFNSTRDEADAVGSALLTAAARVSPGPLELSGSYVAAARKFAVHFSHDTLAQEAAAELAIRPLGTVQVAVDGRIKDRRGGPRRYSDLQSALVLRWQAVPELEVELHAGAHRFINRADIAYSFSSPEAGGRVRYRFDRRHTLTLGGELGHQRYNALAVVPPTNPDPAEVTREDGVLVASAGYGYRGAFQFSAGYQYFDEDSNSHGQTLRFHRVDLALGTPLPWNLLLFAQLTLQLGDYPDGISLAPMMTLSEDEERHSAFQLKLVRPLGERVDLELRYGVYANVLRQTDGSQPELPYFRQVASVGLAARM
ncbi:MAG TPA: hypothetical protein VIG99_17465 [Myxococcaceae bacterium]